MAYAHPVTTNRGAQFSVGAFHVLLGVALTFFINHYVRDFSILRASKWYDSYWLPLWVACLTLAFEAYVCSASSGMALRSPDNGTPIWLARGPSDGPIF